MGYKSVHVPSGGCLYYWSSDGTRFCGGTGSKKDAGAPFSDYRNKQGEGVQVKKQPKTLNTASSM